METILNDIHLSSETLERFVRGKLTESEVIRISDHLFECDACNERYDREVQIVVDLRSAASAERGRPTKARKFLRQLVLFWPQVTSRPGPALAIALAVVLAFFFVPRLGSISASPAVAELTAFRGADSQSAPANRRLVLRLDTTGLDGARHLRAEVADSAGNKVWSGEAKARSNGVEVSVDTPLSPGQYWVRLNAPNESDILREFSLLVK